MHILYTHICMHMHACVCISVWVRMYIYMLKFCMVFEDEIKWMNEWMNESVNSTIFFWHAQKLRQGVYLRDFIIVIYGKFNSNFPGPFLAFFHLFFIMNLYLRAFSIAIYQKFDLYYLCLLRLFSGLQILQFWSVNYASYFRSS